MIIGGAGYGKSALAAEACERVEVLAIRAVLESGGVPAALLPHRLRSAAARVGLSDIAVRMDQAAAAGPAGMLDAMLEALGGHGAVIVVDEIQHAEPAAVALLSRLAAQLGPGPAAAAARAGCARRTRADAPGRRGDLDRHR